MLSHDPCLLLFLWYSRRGGERAHQHSTTHGFPLLCPCAARDQTQIHMHASWCCATEPAPGVFLKAILGGWWLIWEGAVTVPGTWLKALVSTCRGDASGAVTVLQRSLLSVCLPFTAHLGFMVLWETEPGTLEPPAEKSLYISIILSPLLPLPLSISS